MKVSGIDQQPRGIDVGSVDSGHRRARVRPYAQPRALPAAEIDDTADRDDRR
jgi:hypothetical protein